MKRQLKVSIIEPVGGHGGMNYYDFGLCSGLAQAGVSVLLETCDETKPIYGHQFLVRRPYRKIFGSAPQWKRGLSYLRGSVAATISAVLEHRKICHFHLFHVGVLETINVLLARLFFRRIVITAHDVESFVEALEVPVLSRWVYRQAAGVIAHNKVSAYEVVKRMSIPHKKVVIIPHGNYAHMLGVPPLQVEARQSLGIPKNAKVILFFGQIKDVKGLDLLIKAMRQVVIENPSAIVLVAGKPWKSDFTFYENLMKELDIRDKCISHIRYIPDDEVSQFYAASDVVVLPYRRIYQSGVVLMAMSYKKAVLVSDLPGMTEIISDGENGYVFRQGCEIDLALKLKLILSDDVEREKVALRGFNYIKHSHDWSQIGEATAQLYEKILR